MLSFKMSRFYSLLRSETIQKSWIFLQNSDKNKLWMLHYLLYIIIQKGIPAMGCLDAVLEMRVLWRERVGGWRGFWERLHGGFCYRELLFTLSSSYCCVFCRAEWYKTASRQKKQNRSQPWGGFHHEEGAPTLLFLMVASEHSASDVSQSESPNWSGFCERWERRTQEHQHGGQLL